jgi:hypothetical protein
MLKSKIITIFLFSALFSVALLFGHSCLANESIINFKPQVTIPGLSNEADNSMRIENNSIGKYIDAIYRYGVTAIGILAVVVMMIGGIMLISSGGSQERVQSAKSWIGASATGLILALTSYSILYFINPDLVQYGALNVENIKPITVEKSIAASNIQGCCIKHNANERECSTTMEDKCPKEIIYEFHPKIECVEIKECDKIIPKCSDPCQTDKGEKGYCSGDFCLPCKEVGADCSNWFTSSGNMECCSNNCVKKNESFFEIAGKCAIPKQ